MGGNCGGTKLVLASYVVGDEEGGLDTERTGEERGVVQPRAACWQGRRTLPTKGQSTFSALHVII